MTAARAAVGRKVVDGSLFDPRDPTTPPTTAAMMTAMMMTARITQNHNARMPQMVFVGFFSSTAYGGELSRWTASGAFSL